jgi:hypothetical protein
MSMFRWFEVYVVFNPLECRSASIRSIFARSQWPQQSIIVTRRHHHAFTIGYHAQLSTKLLIAVAGGSRDQMINKKKE